MKEYTFDVYEREEVLMKCIESEKEKKLDLKEEQIIMEEKIQVKDEKLIALDLKEEEIKNHYKREIWGEDMRVGRIRNDTSEYAEDVGGEEMELKIRMYDADLVVKRLQN